MNFLVVLLEENKLIQEDPYLSFGNILIFLNKNVSLICYKTIYLGITYFQYSVPFIKKYIYIHV